MPSAEPFTSLSMRCVLPGGRRSQAQLSRSTGSTAGSAVAGHQSRILFVGVAVAGSAPGRGPHGHTGGIGLRPGNVQDFLLPPELTVLLVRPHVPPHHHQMMMHDLHLPHMPELLLRERHVQLQIRPPPLGRVLKPVLHADQLHPLRVAQQVEAPVDLVHAGDLYGGARDVEDAVYSAVVAQDGLFQGAEQTLHARDESHTAHLGGNEMHDLRQDRPTLHRRIQDLLRGNLLPTRRLLGPLLQHRRKVPLRRVLQHHGLQDDLVVVVLRLHQVVRDHGIHLPVLALLAG
mmetsp:Transcript_55796/g.148683  ORF Transcript_55796/g.148683 Transcript_55796/m.148683 type:complete len:289 (-) Transcript_55796:554-1420(-)